MFVRTLHAVYDRSSVGHAVKSRDEKKKQKHFPFVNVLKWSHRALYSIRTTYVILAIARVDFRGWPCTYRPASWLGHIRFLDVNEHRVRNAGDCVRPSFLALTGSILPGQAWDVTRTTRCRCDVERMEEGSVAGRNGECENNFFSYKIFSRHIIVNALAHTHSHSRMYLNAHTSNEFDFFSATSSAKKHAGPHTATSANLFPSPCHTDTTIRGTYGSRVVDM